MYVPSLHALLPIWPDSVCEDSRSGVCVVYRSLLGADGRLADVRHRLPGLVPPLPPHLCPRHHLLSHRPRQGCEPTLRGHQGDDSPAQRVITPRGANPCCLLSLNLLLTCFSSTCAHISWFKEEGWKYFCRFVFACFTLY